jgi:hypothetical protein
MKVVEMEGDRVRILVTNRLPEATSIHWHGILLPNGMDGVSGLNQPSIKPGETYAYEFTLRQNGTQMYHPHADETLQMAVGMMGLFIIHPREAATPPVDRDFAIMLHEWAIHPGTYRPDPSVMLDFNVFTFNGKVYPATSPLVAKTGQRVRLRGPREFENLSSQLIHALGMYDIQTGSIDSVTGEPTTMGDVVYGWGSQFSDANISALGWFGLLVLVYSSIGLMVTIENSFNSIYGDPNLQKEQIHQVNLGVNAIREKSRPRSRASPTAATRCV